MQTISTRASLNSLDVEAFIRRWLKKYKLIVCKKDIVLVQDRETEEEITIRLDDIECECKKWIEKVM